MRWPPVTRSSSSRPGPLAVVTAVVPTLAICAALLADAEVQVDSVDRAPSEVPLARSVLVCPTGNEAGGVFVASDAVEAGETGEVQAVAGGRASEPRTVEVSPGRRVELADATRVSGVGATAPGLVVQRWSTPGLRAVDCPATSSDQWFTGVGAGAEHTSVLELHNPDAGPATATITVLGQSGPVGAGGRLRGVSVAGGATVRLDLGAEIPKREELALRVTTERGRLAATVIDAFVPIGRGETTKEYLSGQREPATSQLLLGVPDGVDEPEVVVANTSDSVSRVSLRLVTAESTFTPADLEEVLVDPSSVRRFSITKLLRSEVAEGLLGIEVVSSQPATSSFRGRVRGDLLTIVPAGAVSQPTLLPVAYPGSRLVLGGAQALGTVDVVAYDGQGREVSSKVAEVGPEAAVELKVPGRAALLRVTPQGTPVVGSLVLGNDDGAAVVGLRELLREGLVPDVRPGLR